MTTLLLVELLVKNPLASITNYGIKLYSLETIKSAICSNLYCDID
jgi:hypothetical protein